MRTFLYRRAFISCLREFLIYFSLIDKKLFFDAKNNPIIPFTLQIIGSQFAFIIISLTMILSGIILTILNIAVSTSIQVQTPPQILGRVLSVVITLSMALTSIGQLIYGLAFDSINSSIIIFVSTLVLITIGLICKMIIIKNPELSVANPKVDLNANIIKIHYTRTGTFILLTYLC